MRLVKEASVRWATNSLTFKVASSDASMESPESVMSTAVPKGVTARRNGSTPLCVRNFSGIAASSWIEEIDRSRPFAAAGG